MLPWFLKLSVLFGTHRDVDKHRSLEVLTVKSSPGLPQVRSPWAGKSVIRVTGHSSSVSRYHILLTFVNVIVERGLVSKLVV